MDKLQASIEQPLAVLPYSTGLKRPRDTTIRFFVVPKNASIDSFDGLPNRR